MSVLRRWDSAQVGSGTRLGGAKREGCGVMGVIILGPLKRQDTRRGFDVAKKGSDTMEAA